MNGLRRIGTTIAKADSSVQGTASCTPALPGSLRTAQTAQTCSCTFYALYYVIRPPRVPADTAYHLQR
jgi:hypothetical protein